MYHVTESKTFIGRKYKSYILLKLFCKFPITLRFQDFPVPFNSIDGLDLDLQFEKCSFHVQEIDAFLNIGRVILFCTTGNSVFTKDSSVCKFATDLQAIDNTASCDSQVRKENFFWESCSELFPKMAVLKVIGCEDSYQVINTSKLQEKFPSLQSLVFKFVQTDQPIHFPWYTSTEIQNKNVDDFLKVIFASFNSIYFYNLFPANTMMLINCRVETRYIHLEGNIDFVSLTDMGLMFINSNFLQNITIKQTLNLSRNRLKFISTNLLINQHMIKELYLQVNDLTYIVKYMFSGLKNLIYINLSENKIKYIIGTPFVTLRHLKDIILSNNSITHIPDGMFRDQIDSLEYLKIDSNPGLTDIPLWPLYGTKSRAMDLSHCNITGYSIIQLLDQLDQLDINEKLVEAGLNVASLPLGGMTSIYLNFNKIETIPWMSMTAELKKKFKNLLTNFLIDFSDNPFTCNCDTSVIQEIVKDLNNSDLDIHGLGWICQKPSEFHGRPIWTIENHEKYCPINNQLCPVSCSCFKRNDQETIIVDCRDTVLEDMPKNLPMSKLELWFQNSNISEIGSLPYLENVTVLNIAQNKLKNIEPSTLNQLKNLKVLNLKSNHLTSLPFQISALPVTKLTLSDNLFVCECTTVWMKGWLLNDEGTIPDWASIKCLDINENLKQLIAVPDSEFVCEAGSSFRVIEHVFLPSIITGSVLFVLVTISLLVYFQRFNLKVWLFINFNFHPFDNKMDREKSQVYDAVIIYAESDLELKVKIENHLTQKHYKVADMYRNSLIGYTYIENIEYLIRKSNKIIILISMDTVHDKIIQAAWNISYDHVLSTSMTRLILVAEKSIKQEPNLDINLSQFLKGNHFLNRNTKLLSHKVEYLMPKMKERLREQENMEMNQRHNNQIVTANHCDGAVDKIVISYPDVHHSYVINEIIPFLMENCVQVNLLDMEFTPGADIRDELPTVLQTCRHLIFLLSSETLRGEVRMYILSQALTMTQLENHNFLIVCTSGRVCLDHMTNDLSRYIENYVTISTNEPRFKERILESIHNNSGDIDGDEEDHVENDPLL